MNPKLLIKTAEHFVRSNSPAILAGIGAAGAVATAYFAARVGFTVGYRTAHADEAGTPRKTKKEFVKEYWKDLLPPVITGTVTVGSIIGAVKIGNRRTAAITAAYSLSEKAFQEYKDKVTEKIGERKEQSVRDELAQQQVTATAPGREIVLMGTGDSLCCDLQNGRYFLAKMEQLKKAQNDINFQILHEGHAYLHDFYVMIGVYLPKESPYGHSMGWDKTHGPMELEFSVVLADETRPCLAFKYNYLEPV